MHHWTQKSYILIVAMEHAIFLSNNAEPIVANAMGKRCVAQERAEPWMYGVWSSDKELLIALYIDTCAILMTNIVPSFLVLIQDLKKF